MDPYMIYSHRIFNSLARRWFHPRTLQWMLHNIKSRYLLQHWQYQSYMRLENNLELCRKYQNNFLCRVKWEWPQKMAENVRYIIMYGLHHLLHLGGIVITSRLKDYWIRHDVKYIIHIPMMFLSMDYFSEKRIGQVMIDLRCIRFTY